MSVLQNTVGIPLECCYCDWKNPIRSLWIAVGVALSIASPAIAWVWGELRSCCEHCQVYHCSSRSFVKQHTEFSIKQALQIACGGVRSGRHLCKLLQPIKDTYIKRPQGNLRTGWCLIFSPAVWLANATAFVHRNFLEVRKDREPLPKFSGGTLLYRKATWVCIPVPWAIYCVGNCSFCHQLRWRRHALTRFLLKNCCFLWRFWWQYHTLVLFPLDSVFNSSIWFCWVWSYFTWGNSTATSRRRVQWSKGCETAKEPSWDTREKIQYQYSPYQYSPFDESGSISFEWSGTSYG